MYYHIQKVKRVKSGDWRGQGKYITFVVVYFFQSIVLQLFLLDLQVQGAGGTILNENEIITEVKAPSISCKLS